MKHHRFASVALAIAVISVAAAPAQAGSAAAIRAIDFVPHTLVPGQGGRVSLVNFALAGTHGLPVDPCRGLLHFYDESGDPVGDAQSFDLAPGTATSLPAVQFVGGAPVRQLRAQVLLPAVQLPVDPCRAIGVQFELYDTKAQETLLVSQPALVRP